MIDRQGLAQVGDAASIGEEVEAVLAEFPAQVAEYRAGKQQVYGFLVGQVMKRTAGRADARLVNEELRRRLEGEQGSAELREETPGRSRPLPCANARVDH